VNKCIYCGREIDSNLNKVCEVCIGFNEW